MQRAVAQTFSVLVFFVGFASTLFAQSPYPMADFDATPLVGCAPLTVHFHDRSGPDVSIWKWDFDNDGVDDITGDPAPTHTYTVPGTYTVRYTASNTLANTVVTKTNYIVVTDPITITVTTLSACTGDSLTLLATVTGGLKPYHYYWSCATLAESSTLDQPTIVVDSTQTWTVVVTDSLGCSSTTTFTIVAQSPPMKPTIIHYGNTLTCSQKASTYQWLLNSSMIPGATDISYTVNFIETNGGQYQVRTTNTGGCSSKSEPVLISQIADVGVDNLNEGWSLYPNPTSGKLIVNAPISNSSITDIALFSTLGEQLRQGNIDELSSRITVSLTDLPAGLYVLQVTTNNARHVFRVVKE